ncbi:MAG: glycoside hydrolase family 78 protein [Chloroflexota bacterium]
MTHTITVTALTCEYLTNPLGIDVTTPRLSWQLTADHPNVSQVAYHIQVSDEHGVVWDSGRVDSCQSVLVRYGGPTLISRQRYRWRVRVWANGEHTSEWSDEAWWEMGLLNRGDWQAQWIDPEGDIAPEAFKPAPYLRRTFTLDQPVRSARIYATAHGLYELHLNGQRVGDQVMTPGWTSYHHRLQYQVYDVTDLLNTGQNAIGAIVGDGWWRGKVGFESLRNTYGERLALLVQLHITYEDGSETSITTDEHWKTTTGPIIKSDFKDGEIYDARLEIPHWNTPDFDDCQWKVVTVVNHKYNHLIAEITPPVRKKEAFHPIYIITTPAGQTVLDFSQNISGWVRMSISGPAGTTIKLTHGEALDKDGNFPPGVKLPIPGSDQLLQETHYTLKGQGVEVFEPHFTSQGFRYVWLEGYPGIPNPNEFTAIAIYSDMPQTGTFACSSKQITQLHNNVVWSMKGNFMDIPTDCPTRERAGWTGDAQVFARTGATLMQTSGFFNKWLQDLATDQKPNGIVPNFIPDPYQPTHKEDLLVTGTEGSAGWGDAAVIIPWELYWCFGDTDILEQQYSSMVAWFNYVHKRAQHTHWVRKISPSYWLDTSQPAHWKTLWDTNYHWGEWLEPDKSFAHIIPGILYRLVFSSPTVASAYYKHITDVMTYTAAVLGKPAEARYYRQLSEQIREAYTAMFVKPDGSMEPDTQASYVRLLQFNLVPEEMRPRVVQQLLRLIHAADLHVGTGFLSTGFLCRVLAEEGHADVAYALLNQDTTPSWLYAINRGATTIWEMWEAIKPDGSIEGSHNHYSKGTIAEFLYRIVAGIEIGAPGYQHIIFQPKPGGGLTWARSSHQSMYGEIAAAWQIEEGTFSFEVVVPPNTTAEIRLPDKSAPISVGSGQHRLSCAWKQQEELSRVV